MRSARRSSGLGLPSAATRGATCHTRSSASCTTASTSTLAANERRLSRNGRSARAIQRPKASRSPAAMAGRSSDSDSVTTRGIYEAEVEFEADGTCGAGSSHRVGGRAWRAGWARAARRAWIVRCRPWQRGGAVASSRTRGRGSEGLLVPVERGEDSMSRTSSLPSCLVMRPRARSSRRRGDAAGLRRVRRMRGRSCSRPFAWARCLRTRRFDAFGICPPAMRGPPPRVGTSASPAIARAIGEAIAIGAIVARALATMPAGAGRALRPTCRTAASAARSRVASGARVDVLRLSIAIHEVRRVEMRYCRPSFSTRASISSRSAPAARRVSASSTASRPNSAAITPLPLSRLDVNALLPRAACGAAGDHELAALRTHARGDEHGAPRTDRECTRARSRAARAAQLHVDDDRLLRCAHGCARSGAFGVFVADRSRPRRRGPRARPGR